MTMHLVVEGEPKSRQNGKKYVIELDRKGNKLGFWIHAKESKRKTDGWHFIGATSLFPKGIGSGNYRGKSEGNDDWGGGLSVDRKMDIGFLNKDAFIKIHNEPDAKQNGNSFIYVPMAKFLKAMEKLLS